MTQKTTQSAAIITTLAALTAACGTTTDTRATIPETATVGSPVHVQPPPKNNTATPGDNPDAYLCGILPQNVIDQALGPNVEQNVMNDYTKLLKDSPSEDNTPPDQTTYTAAYSALSARDGMGITKTPNNTFTITPHAAGHVRHIHPNGKPPATNNPTLHKCYARSELRGLISFGPFNKSVADIARKVQGLTDKEKAERAEMSGDVEKIVEEARGAIPMDEESEKLAATILPSTAGEGASAFNDSAFDGVAPEEATCAQWRNHVGLKDGELVMGSASVVPQKAPKASDIPLDELHTPGGTVATTLKYCSGGRVTSVTVNVKYSTDEVRLKAHPEVASRDEAVNAAKAIVAALPLAEG